MHWSAGPRGDDVVTRVQSALAAKTVLEIAKGMIAAHEGLPLKEAGRLLDDYADRHRVSLAATAQALVDRDMDITAVREGALGV